MCVDLKGKKEPVITLHPGIMKSNLDAKWKEEGAKVEGAVELEVAAAGLRSVLMGRELRVQEGFVIGVARSWHDKMAVSRDIIEQYRALEVLL